MSGFFSVKNFERFQHYKDRSPPWIKLYNELLDDYEFGKLPDASKMHLVAIWLLASRYENKIPLDAEWVARRINATDPVDLKRLSDAGFLVVDQGCSIPLAERKQNAMPETEREGEAERETEKRTRAPRAAPLGWEEWWQAYPHKVGKPAALKAFRSAAAKASLEDLLAGLRRYITGKPPDRPWCNPATWLNQERWLDQPAAVTVNGHVQETGILVDPEAAERKQADTIAKGIRLASVPDRRVWGWVRKGWLTAEQASKAGYSA